MLKNISLKEEYAYAISDTHNLFKPYTLVKFPEWLRAVNAIFRNVLCKIKTWEQDISYKWYHISNKQ